MKLGFLTACLPGVRLEKIADWASAHDFQALEVAVWPDVPGRPFEASHIDVATLDPRGAEQICSYLADKGLEISALAYYENNLHPDEQVREGTRAHLRSCIDAARLLGCRFVGTFVGRDWNRSVSENVKLGNEILPVARRVRRRARHPAHRRELPDGGVAPRRLPGRPRLLPELWEWMFSLGFYLNYDPSHLTWLGIDPIAALRSCPIESCTPRPRTSRSTRTPVTRWALFGKVLHRSNPWDNGWYRYRVPGLGMIDWSGIVDALYQVGFDGVLSVEHEDPVWSGDEGRVLGGLAISHDTLRPLIRRDVRGLTSSREAIAP